MELLASQLEKNTFKSMTKEQYAILERIVLQWPTSTRFPAIDLLRLTVLSSIAQLNVKHLLSLFPADSSALDKHQEINVMLLLRLLCNLFSQKDAHTKLMEHGTLILQKAMVLPAQSANKNLHLALATLLAK